MDGASFPDPLDTRLGSLRLEETLTPDWIHRAYVSEQTAAPGQTTSVRLVVWPPESGIANARSASRFVESAWDYYWNHRPMVLASARQFMEEVVRNWWAPDPFPTEAVEPMLEHAVLEQFGVNLDGPHELRFRTDDTLVSQRDIVIYLSSATNQAIGAQLDG